MQEGEANRTAAVVTEDILGRLGRRGQGYWIAAIVLGVLALLGVVGVIVRLVGGAEGRVGWGYYAATFAFLLSTVQAAPLILVALRMTRADWRRPLVRPVEFLALGGIVTTLMFLPLPGSLPPLQGRLNLWFDWPVGAPGVWDTLAVLLLAMVGLAILYVGLLPDLAMARDVLDGQQARRYGRLSLGWQGTRQQWRILRLGLTLLGAFYLMMYVFVHLLVSVDFAMSLVPGWRSAIFPAYHAVTGLQGAVAVTIVTLALLRRVGGLQSYVGLDQFWGLAKLLLALSLFWFYFWWSDFVTFWFGRTPREQAVLQLLITDPYWTAFILTITLTFAVPFLALIWNRVRVSILGPTLVAMGVLVGLFFDRVRLYVSAYSVEEVTAHALEHIPPTHFPDLVDVAMVIGALAAVALFYLLAVTVLPVMSLWEVKEGLLLRVTRTFLRSEYTIIGKPH